MYLQRCTLQTKADIEAADLIKKGQELTVHKISWIKRTVSSFWYECKSRTN